MDEVLLLDKTIAAVPLQLLLIIHEFVALYNFTLTQICPKRVISNALIAAFENRAVRAETKNSRAPLRATVARYGGPRVNPSNGQPSVAELRFC